MGPVGYKNMILVDMNAKEFIRKIVLGRTYLLDGLFRIVSIFHSLKLFNLFLNIKSTSCLI